MAKETKAKPAEEKKPAKRCTKKADAAEKPVVAKEEKAKDVKAKEAKAKETKAKDTKAEEDAKAEIVRAIEAKAAKVRAEKAKAAKAKAEAEEAKAEETKAAASDDDQPDVPENEIIKRYDLMITSERAGYKPPKYGVVSMVQQLAYRGFASPVDEAIAETWTEIYFEPGPAAHEIFLEKNYTDEAPVFHELRLRFSDKPFFCDYSQNPKRPLYFAIEILGSRFKSPIGAFRKLFLDALNLRIATDFHDAEPIPPRKEVPEDEKPFEKKKHERGAGLAGTDVEET